MTPALSAMLSSSFGDAGRHVMIAAGSVAALLVVGAVVIRRLRRHASLADRREDGTEAGGFSLDDLERMRGSGRISKEEFRTLRRAALGLDAAPAKTDNSASSAPVGAADDDSTASAEGSCAGGDGQKE